MKIENDVNSNYLILRPEDEMDIFRLGIISTKITMPTTFTNTTDKPKHRLDYVVLEKSNLLNFLINENKEEC